MPRSPRFKGISGNVLMSWGGVVVARDVGLRQLGRQLLGRQQRVDRSSTAPVATRFHTWQVCVCEMRWIRSCAWGKKAMGRGTGFG